VAPGSDILIGQGGDDDYDMEGGDDIGLGGPGIEKVAGASGYDWEIGLGDPQPQDLDLDVPLIPLNILEVDVRDKFNEVEAVSGGDLDDKLRGDDVVPSAVGGAGFIGCDALDQDGLDRIAGLDALVPPLTTSLQSVVDVSESKECPILHGPVWGAGNILLGGAGDDLFEGRGGDDIIDGDKYLSVRLSVRTDPDDPTTEIGSAGINQEGQSAMTSQYLRDPQGQLTGPTLQEAVFAGDVDPGNIVAVREVLDPPASDDSVDTAVFTGPESEYDVSTAADGTVTVVHDGGAGVDGTDTLRNIEQLQFGTGDTVEVTPAATVPSATDQLVATAGDASATLSWTEPADGGSPITGYRVQVFAGPGGAAGSVLLDTVTFDGTETTRVVPDLTNGASYTFRVSAVNAIGVGARSFASNDVVPRTTPSAPTGVQATARDASASVSWQTPARNGGAPVSGYRVEALEGTTVVRTASVGAAARSATVTGLVNGRLYTLQVRAVNEAGTGEAGRAPGTVRPMPAAPVVTGRSPAANAANAGVGSNVAATFDVPVTGVRSTTFRLRRGTATTGASVAATVSYDTRTRRATLNPSGPLAADTRYTATLTGGASAIRRTGSLTVPLATTSWTFRTAPDRTRPRVTGSIAPRVRTGAAVRVRFTEPVRGVDSSTVRLRASATGRLVRATVRLSADRRTATIDPRRTLARNTGYTVFLRGGRSALRDLAGNPLVPTSRRFRTVR
jgi:hypothetical protein